MELNLNNKTISCIEIPNLHKLNFIISNQDEIKKLNYENIIQDAINYKAILKKKSKIQVDYRENKNIRRKMFPGINSTTMSRNLRNFLFDNVIDLDIQNSSVSVYISIINIFNLGNFPILNNVFQNKYNFLNENDCSKEELVSILNGGLIQKSDKLILSDIFNASSAIDFPKKKFGTLK